jgi:hypothetical protein
MITCDLLSLLVSLARWAFSVGAANPRGSNHARATGRNNNRYPNIVAPSPSCCRALRSWWLWSRPRIGTQAIAASSTQQRSLQSTGTIWYASRSIRQCSGMSPHPSFLTLFTQSARRAQPADATKSSARSAASAEQAVYACTSRASAGEKDAQQAPASSGGEQSVVTLRGSGHSDTLARARTQTIAVSTTGRQAASTGRSQQGEGGRQRTAKLVRGHQHHHLLRPALASHLHLRGGSVPMLPGQRLAHQSPSRSGVQIF